MYHVVFQKLEEVIFALLVDANAVDCDADLVMTSILEDPSIIGYDGNDFKFLLAKGCVLGYKKLMQYYGKTSLRSAYAVGTALHPALKLQFWENFNWQLHLTEGLQKIRILWRREYKKHRQQEQDANQHHSGIGNGSINVHDSNSSRNTFRYFEQVIRQRTSNSGAEEDQLESFLTTTGPPLADSNSNDILYWKSQDYLGSGLDQLAKMARDYLRIPTTSTSSERIFSIAGRLVTSDRNKLETKNVRKIMLTKNWLKNL